MNNQTEPVKAEFQRAIGRLLTNLDGTPEDKLNWSPSPTARTPLEVAHHCGFVISALHGALSGTQAMPPLSTQEMDSYNREDEKTHGAKAEVVKGVEEKSAAFIAYLESLSEEDLTSTWHSPFGDFPVSLGITFPAFHTAGHIAQLEYIQTIWGDRVWQ